MNLFRPFIIPFLFLGLMTACSSDDSGTVTEQNKDENEEQVMPDEGEQSDPVEDDELKSSLAFRFTLEKMRSLTERNGAASPTGRQNGEQLCFQFEYPILLGFSDESETTVNDYEALLDIIFSETPEVHITSIGFPFDVMLEDGTTQTIEDEDGFQDLVQDCGYNDITVEDVASITEDCFTVNYPIALTINGDEETFENQDEISTYFSENISSVQSISPVYPFSVNLVADDSTVTINDNFELINLINDTCGIN